jgi:spore germination protein KA
LFKIRWKSRTPKKYSPKNTARQNPGGLSNLGRNSAQNPGAQEPLPEISSSVMQPDWLNLSLTGSLQKDLLNLKAIFKNCDDVIFHEFNMGQNREIRLALIYVDALSSSERLSREILIPLKTKFGEPAAGNRISPEQTFEYIKNCGAAVAETEEAARAQTIVDHLLSGEAVLLMEGSSKALIFDTRGYKTRDITDSLWDRSVRGSRESFVENLFTNTSLLRRKIKNPALKVETSKIGRVNRTDLAIAYVEGIVDPDTVDEVKKRLSRIDIDGALEGGQLEEFIEDSPYSPFPTVFHSDRVDKVAAKLMEGRVAIILDGTPSILTVPALFIEYFQNPEDYYQRYMFSSAVRILRLFAFFLSISGSALYIALSTYHLELIPTALLLSFTAQREAVPFPLFVEVFLMEVSFEILREAGLRMPQPLGQALSIVGAVVLGEAGVRAGIVSAATVIIVAITAIASFSFLYSSTIIFRLIRFPLIIGSAILGLPGLVILIFFMTFHLVSLRSFGVPYLYPAAPLSVYAQQDTIMRAPWWAMRKRPCLLTGNLQREASGQRPQPPSSPPNRGEL